MSDDDENIPNLVEEFEEIIGLVMQSRNDELEDSFLSFAIQAEAMRVKWFETTQECRRLQAVLHDKTCEIVDISSKLNQARALIDHERTVARKAEEEKDVLKEVIVRIREIVAKDASQLNADTRDSINFINSIINVLDCDLPSVAPQLSAINEGNTTTGSLLSDFSYSKSEDDLDISNLQGKTWKKHRPSTGAHPACQKNLKSSHKVVSINYAGSVGAATAVAVPTTGPITRARGRRPLAPMPDAPLAHSTTVFDRPHTLQHKALVIPDKCTVCNRRIGFARGAWKCSDCGALVHGGKCRDALPLPCVPDAGRLL